MNFHKHTAFIVLFSLSLRIYAIEDEFGENHVELMNKINSMRNDELEYFFKELEPAQSERLKQHIARDIGMVDEEQFY